MIVFNKKSFTISPCTIGAVCLGAKTFKTYKKSKQAGRSMIEMLGVLAIVGILSAGGIAGYSMAMQNHKTNQLIDKIQLMAQQSRILWGNFYPAGLKAEDLKNAGMIQDYDNPFGGQLSMSWSSSSGQTAFWIKAGVDDYSLPADTCVKLVLYNWGDSGVFSGVHIFGKDGSSRGYHYSNGDYPVPKATAITRCQGGEKGVQLLFK